VGLFDFFDQLLPITDVSGESAIALLQPVNNADLKIEL